MIAEIRCGIIVKTLPTKKGKSCTTGMGISVLLAPGVVRKLAPEAIDFLLACLEWS